MLASTQCGMTKNKDRGQDTTTGDVCFLFWCILCRTHTEITMAGMTAHTIPPPPLSRCCIGCCCWRCWNEGISGGGGSSSYALPPRSGTYQQHWICCKLLRSQNKGVLVKFLWFHTATQFQEWTALKSLKIQQDNLGKKFSAVNVYFNSASFGRLGTRAWNLGIPFKTCNSCYCQLI